MREKSKKPDRSLIFTVLTVVLAVFSLVMLKLAIDNTTKQASYNSVIARQRALLRKTEQLLKTEQLDSVDGIPSKVQEKRTQVEEAEEEIITAQAKNDDLKAEILRLYDIRDEMKASLSEEEVLAKERDLADLKAEYEALTKKYNKLQESHKPETNANRIEDSVAGYTKDDLPALLAAYRAAQNAYLQALDDEESVTALSVYKEDMCKKRALYLRANALYGVSTEPEDKKICYLTFDDGVSANTDRILDILKKYGIHATFFPNWHSGETAAARYKRIVAEGHTLGNHTKSHDWDSVYGNPAGFADEVIGLSEKLYNITGVYPNVFRFPGGSSNTKYNYRADAAWKDTYKGERKLFQADINTLYAAGFQYFDWNVNSTDADNSLTPKSAIVKAVLNGCRNKTRAVVLMHDLGSKTTTVEALPEIIDGLTEMGFTFEILTDTTVPVHSVQPNE